MDLTNTKWVPMGAELHTHEGKWLCSIAREHDGKWHLYVDKPGEDDDGGFLVTYDTEDEAKEAATRFFTQQDWG